MGVQVDVRCITVTAVPTEDQPPLLVDSDRVKAIQVALQLLEMVTGWYAQVLIRRRIVNHLELPEQPVFEIGRDSVRANIVDKERSQPVVPKVHNHVQPPLSEGTTPWYTSWAMIGSSPARGNVPIPRPRVSKQTLDRPIHRQRDEFHSSVTPFNN